MKIVVSEKKDGAMDVSENKLNFLKRNKIIPKSLVLAGICHGNKTVRVDENDQGKVMPGIDGLITTSEKIVLGVTVSDCLPIFFFSDKMVGVLHAGWKGIEKGIIEKTMEKIEEIERKKKLSFFIGPGIDDCHFEVQGDVFNKFKEFKNARYERKGKKFLSIKKIAEEKILRGGVEKVSLSSVCTYCDENYFSFRRDKKINKMLALIKK